MRTIQSLLAATLIFSNLSGASYADPVPPSKEERELLQQFEDALISQAMLKIIFSASSIMDEMQPYLKLSQDDIEKADTQAIKDLRTNLNKSIGDAFIGMSSLSCLLNVGSAQGGSKALANTPSPLMALAVPVEILTRSANMNLHGIGTVASSASLTSFAALSYYFYDDIASLLISDKKLEEEKYFRRIYQIENHMGSQEDRNTTLRSLAEVLEWNDIDKHYFLYELHKEIAIEAARNSLMSTSNPTKPVDVYELISKVHYKTGAGSNLFSRRGPVRIPSPINFDVVRKIDSVVKTFNSEKITHVISTLSPDEKRELKLKLIMDWRKAAASTAENTSSEDVKKLAIKMVSDIDATLEKLQ